MGRNLIMAVQKTGMAHLEATTNTNEFDVGQVEFSSWNLVDDLVDEDEIQALLEAALEDGDPALIASMIRKVQRARTVNSVTKATGLDRSVVCAFFAPARELVPDISPPHETVVTPDQIKIIARAVIQAAA